MSWEDIKKKREKEEEEDEIKKSSSAVSYAISNFAGSFWKKMGQEALSSQREEEQKKDDERKERNDRRKFTQGPKTYNRTVHPSDMQAISQNNRLADRLTNTTGHQSMRLATQNETNNMQRVDSLWTKIQNIAKNIGYTIDNAKSGLENGIFGLGQTTIRDSSDIHNFAENIATNVTKKVGTIFGVPEERTELITRTQFEPMREQREKDLERLQEIRTKNQNQIQQNIQQAQTGGIISGDKVGPKIVELAPSIGQQIPGMIATKINPVLSFAYFKGSAEANYYDDAKERGMTETQSKIYSKLMSYVEAGTEQLSVGNIQKGGEAINAVTKGIKQNGVKNGIKAGIDIFKNTAQEETTNMIKGALKDYGIGIAEEAFQEAITEPIQELVAMKVAGEDKADWNNIWQRMVQSGIDGGLSSAIIAGANLGVSSCKGLVTKVENGHIPTQEEYKGAFKDASKKVDVQKLTIDGIKREVGNYKRYLQNNQNVNEQVINEENKTVQNGFSQEENQTKQDLTNKLAQVRQFYDEDTYNQMRNFIETAPSEKALNQINEDMKAETKNRLEEAYKSERFTESQTRKQAYAKYQRQNNTTGIEYNSDVVNNALDTVAPNRNGRRTVGQWKQVAEQIGLNSADLTKSQIDDIAYGSWFDLQPTKNITQYDNRSKEHKGFEKFTSDDWINTIYESAKGQKIQKLDTVLNQNIANNQEMLYNNITLGEVKNIPTEEVMKFKDDRNGGHRTQEQYEKLKRDIEENGIKNPIELVRNNDGSIEIENGNHRLQVANELGIKEVPVKFVESWDNIGIDEDSSESKIIERMEAYNDKNNKDSRETNLSNGRSRIVEGDRIDNRNESENRETGTGNDRLSNRTQEVYNRPSSDTTFEKNAKELEYSSSLNLQQENIQNTKGEAINWTEIERPENNQKFRKHYRSIIESSNTTAEAKAIAKELMGTDTYTPETNKGQLAQADQRIMTSSPETELQALRSRVLNGERITSVDIAVGERLIQYFSKTGSVEQLQDAIQTTALAGTSTGQTLQAMTILNHQTPQGQVTWLQRSIDKVNKELAKKKGGTITTDADGNLQIVNKQGKDITNKVNLFELTPEMMNKIMQSENHEQMLKNIDEVYEELGQQVPKSMLEKIDSWRYFSMLANIRTHGRNMIGNFAMGKMQRVKDKLAGGIEDVVSKFNPEMERTKTLRRADKKTKEFAKQDFKNADVQSMMELNENKYNPQSRLQNARKTFKHDALENTLGRLFDLNDTLLEKEDGIGLKAGYQKALADYITANKIDVDNITDAQLSKARNYAVQQAKEATFHQANAIASAIAQFENKNMATKLFTGAILPFKKTPMNVAKAGMEYSPLQIAKSATLDVVNLRKGNISINQYIDNLSKGLTGTGVALVGYALANAGILKASGDDDTDKEKYDEEQGKQRYSIEIGGKTFSLDWLAPTGIPLFVGAETFKLFNQEEAEKSTEKRSEDDRLNQAIKGATNLLSAGATAINPMSEMSMISGLTSALSSYNTSDNLGSLGNIMTNAGKSYINQFVPTLLGQVAKTGDEYERTTKSTATGTIGKAVDQTINQIKAKVPGLRQTLPIKTDIWGNELKQEANLPLRAINNFINPATVKEVSTDKVDAELNKLYEENKNSSLLPDILTKTVQLNKQTYRLNNKEYAEFTKNYGQTSHKLIEDFIKTKEYSDLTQEQKETAISDIYSYAKEQNKLEYAKKVGENVKPSTLYTIIQEIEKGGGKQSEYLNYLAKTKGMSKESEKNKVLSDSNYSNKTKEIIYINGTGKDDNLYNDLLSKTNINMTEYLKYKNKISEKAFSADKDENGKTITGSAKEKVINYLNNNITGLGNKLLIAGNSYVLTNSEKQKLAEYINQIATTKDDRINLYKNLEKNFTVKDDKVYMKVSNY